MYDKSPQKRLHKYRRRNKKIYKSNNSINLEKKKRTIRLIRTIYNKPINKACQDSDISNIVSLLQNTVHQIQPPFKKKFNNDLSVLCQIRRGGWALTHWKFTLAIAGPFQFNLIQSNKLY